MYLGILDLPLPMLWVSCWSAQCYSMTWQIHEQKQHWPDKQTNIFFLQISNWEKPFSTNLDISICTLLLVYCNQYHCCTFRTYNIPYSNLILFRLRTPAGSLIRLYFSCHPDSGNVNLINLVIKVWNYGMTYLHKHAHYVIKRIFTSAGIEWLSACVTQANTICER